MKHPVHHQQLILSRYAVVCRSHDTLRLHTTTLYRCSRYTDETVLQASCQAHLQVLSKMFHAGAVIPCVRYGAIQSSPTRRCSESLTLFICTLLSSSFTVSRFYQVFKAGFLSSCRSKTLHLSSL